MSKSSSRRGGKRNEDDKLAASLYLIHCESSVDQKALPSVHIIVESDNGDWASDSNACGDIIDPARQMAGVTLSPGEYKCKFYDKTGKQLEHNVVGLEYLVWNLEWPPDEPIRVGLKAAPYVPSGTLPAVPSRAQVCAIQHSLQGLTYHTAQYGPIPAWFYACLSPEDRAQARQDHRDGRDTHIPIPISEAYRESGTLWPESLKDGYDYTQDLDSLRAVCFEAICDGFFIDMPLAGDGLGAGPGYNDPVGRTYGCEWLMANLERIIQGLRGDGTPEKPDLTPYIIFRPGWDAVFYGWGGDGKSSQYGLRWRHVRSWWRARKAGQTLAVPSQQELDSQQKRVRDFGQLFRQILPNGYLAIEHTPGNIPCGEGGSDYAPGGLMTTFDTMMGEYATVHEDSFWQIAGRMVSPYYRPPDQPAGDDPNPPFYLSPGSERGPYFYIAFEPTKGGVYEWCRGNCTLDQVRDVDRYMRAAGCLYTGYSEYRS